MSARSPFDDRPAIGVALVRFGLALIVLVAGVFQLQRHGCGGGGCPRLGPARRPTSPAVALPASAIVLGLVLLFGLAPRLAAWLILIEAVLVMILAGRTDGGFYLTFPPVFIFLAVVVIGAGGGRWALVDRLDPPRQRRLERLR